MRGARRALTTLSFSTSNLHHTAYSRCKRPSAICFCSAAMISSRDILGFTNNKSIWARMAGAMNRDFRPSTVGYSLPCAHRAETPQTHRHHAPRHNDKRAYAKTAHAAELSTRQTCHRTFRTGFVSQDVDSAVSASSTTIKP